MKSTLFFVFKAPTPQNSRNTRIKFQAQKMGTKLFSISQIYCQTALTNKVLQPCCHKQDYRVSQTELSRANNKSNKGYYNNVRIKTLDGCKLGISQYRFKYNAEGGRGIGNRIKVKEDEVDGEIPFGFELDLRTVHIPPLTSMTTMIDGWWLLYPPFLKVEIVPEIIQGNIYEESGKVELKLKAKYLLSIGSSFEAPPLHIDTILTSEESKGELFTSTRGRRLGKDGKCRLVGVARLDPVDNHYINSLLGLPTECLTSLNATITFF